MPTPITPDNCTNPEIMEEYADHVNDAQKSTAWQIVYNYCLQQGMQKLPHPSSGIERVITFIDNLIKNKINPIKE